MGGPMTRIWPIRVPPEWLVQSLGLTKDGQPEIFLEFDVYKFGEKSGVDMLWHRLELLGYSLPHGEGWKAPRVRIWSERMKPSQIEMRCRRQKLLISHILLFFPVCETINLFFFFAQAGLSWILSLQLIVWTNRTLFQDIYISNQDPPAGDLGADLSPIFPFKFQSIWKQI